MVSLRDFTENDVEKLVTILNNESVTQFLSSKIPSPYTHQDAIWWVNEGSKSELIKAISYKGEMVGCIGIYHGEFEYQKSGEIGYWLAQQYWRKGITLNAINQLVDYVFNNTGIVRLSAPVFSGNNPSMQLLLKAGFKEDAVLEKAIFKNGQYYNSHIFSKLRSF